jgi:crossover junction endodeoxyribonuclease RuvC
MLTLGFDPGTTGAIVLVDVDALRVLRVLDVPLIRDKKLTWVDGAIVTDWLQEFRPEIAVLERVHYWPQDKHPAQTTYMVRIAGGVEACLSTLAIPIVHVEPSAWKRRAGLIGKDKTASLALAKARLSWPAGTMRLAKHEHRAEAALVALFGRIPQAPAKAPKRSKAVDKLAAENVPPGPLFGGAAA